MKYEIVKSFSLPNGGKVKVTVGQDEPINEADYFCLSETGAVNMAECFMNLADTLKPRST